MEKQKFNLGEGEKPKEEKGDLGKRCNDMLIDWNTMAKGASQLKRDGGMSDFEYLEVMQTISLGKKLNPLIGDRLKVQLNGQIVKFMGWSLGKERYGDPVEYLAQNPEVTPDQYLAEREDFVERRMYTLMGIDEQQQKMYGLTGRR